MSLEEVNRLSRIDVDQFYGIEIEEWPARIAEVALWLMDHQSNMRIHEAFSQPCLRLPLRNSPHIHHGNALRMDWNTLLPNTQCSYILGNPPFVRKSMMSANQKYDMALTIREAGGIAGSGVLDYVTAWYIKAAAYIETASIEVAFVSTNSIAQGEQPGILWNYLFSNFHITINFAYQTFAWTSEARGKAHVHVVIISFSKIGREAKALYSYDESQNSMSNVRNISPYLVEGPNTTLLKRVGPICKVPPIIFGNMANDGGHLLLSEEEAHQLRATEPGSAKFIRRFLGAQDMLNGERRFCLWLVDASPAEIRHLPTIRKRIAAVKAHRLKSDREETQYLASFPTLFAEIRQPMRDYLAIPKTSSETRRYIPIEFQMERTIAATELLCIPGATLYHFGVLTSACIWRG